MKELAFGILVMLFCCYGQNSSAQCSSCTINISGNSNQSYNLKKDDVLCILSGGNFTGGINQIHKDAIVCVSDGGYFAPQYLNNWKGLIQNYGTLNLPSFSMNGNGLLINTGGVIMSNPNINGNGAVENQSGGTIDVQGNLHLNGNNSLSNDGDLSISGDLSLGGSSNFENNGHLVVNGNFNLNDNIENHGFLRIKGHMNNNGNGIHNFCTLLFDRGFSNSGNQFINEGFIWILGNDGSQFANSGTFHQTAGAQFRGIDFANSGYITGAGDYYFSGNTANSAYVGFDGEGINFYDASLNNPALFFDQQAVAPHFSVTKNAFTPADTSSWSGGGSADAGADQFLCKDQTTLNAGGSIGSWSLISGSVDFDDVNDPNSMIRNIATGENILQWSEASSCGTASDLVSITKEAASDTTVWLGSVSNDWHEPDNWTHCVPGNITITLIPNTAVSPEIKAHQIGFAKKIKVGQDAQLKLKTAAKLIVADQVE